MNTQQPSFDTMLVVQAIQDGKVVKEFKTIEQFCFMVCMVKWVDVQLLPGVYDFKVQPMVATENIPALSFTEVKGVELKDQRHPEDLVLSPIAQTIAGSVKVFFNEDVKQMFNEDAMTVDLYYGSVKLGSTLTNAKHEFVFKGVLPGEYTLRISDAVPDTSYDHLQKGCWGQFEDVSAYQGSAAEVTVDVRKESVLNAELVQTGYVVSIESPVDATGIIAEGANTKEVVLRKGVSRFCMAGKHYRLTPQACFVCAESSISLSAEHTSVTLIPAEYKIEGIIETVSTSNPTVHDLRGNDLQVLVTALQNHKIVKETTAVFHENHYEYSLVRLRR